MTELSNRIRKLRRKRHLSQETFANALAVSRSHISAIETGAAKPSKQLIKGICREFGVREEWLLKGKTLLGEPDGLSRNEADDFELDIQNTSRTGLYNALNVYCEIILRMAESLWDYSFAFREIGKPDARLLGVKMELHGLLRSLNDSLERFFDILQKQEHVTFKSAKEITELLAKTKSFKKPKSE
jgi:transcriptional regulator with XRE-family HTH domain